MDWLLRRLADRLGVAPAQPGEAITPRLQFEQPWSQLLLIAVVLGSVALVVWLYRREGSASTAYKMMLAAMRIFLILLAMFMLSEAVLSVERTGLPFFIIMADDSASSGVIDQFAEPKMQDRAAELAKIAGKPETRADRLSVAEGLLLKDDAKFIKELQRQHKVKFYIVSNAARPLAEVDKPEEVAKAVEALKKVEATGEQTRLGDGLRQVLTELRGVPPTAVLLMSDGQTTEGEPLAKAAELARQKGVPIFAVGLGDADPAKDLELSDLLVDEVVFVDDLVRFEARLQSRGFAGQDVTLRLRRKKAGSETFEDVETQHVTAPPDGQAKKVEIVHRPRETGEITFVLDVEKKPREINEENNSITRVVNVREERLKVLLIDGEPRYEFRYLKNFLEREKTVELSVLLLSSDVEFAEQDPFALPRFPEAKEGPDGLFSYDVVILGDADPEFLNAAQMKNLVEFVSEKGGGLLFVAGENFNPLAYKRTPLEPLLPIQLADSRNPIADGKAIPAYRPVLTAEGRNHPIFRFGRDEADSRRIWETMPELNWFFEATKKQPAAFVLAVHPQVRGQDGQGVPIILYQFFKAGKVMMNAMDDTWRWRYRVGDNGPFGRFWIQTIRFLARSKMLGQKQAEVTTDRRRYTRNQSIGVKVRFPNPGIAPAGEVTVQVQKKGQGPRKATLRPTPGAKNVFEGVLPPTAEGEYEVQLLPPPVLQGALPTAAFRVDPPAGELERVQMNEAELRRAAEISGGRFATPQNFDSVMKELPPPQKVPLDTDPPIPLWNTPPVLGLFLLTAGLEWVFRKRKQMV